jgi:MFS family permease
MQREAGLTFAEGGWLAAINYGGYLTGALAAAMINDIVLKDRLYRAAMALAAITTAMMGLSADPLVWAISRYLAGVACAGGMLLGTGLVLNWLMRHDYPSELGVHFSGVGLGVAGAAAIVYAMSAFGLDWRQQWLALTAASCVMLWPALGWLPKPERTSISRSGRALSDGRVSPAFLGWCMAFYFCAGVGYVVTATFIVAIVDRLPGLSGTGAFVFLVIGLAAAPASIAWDRVARRVGDVNALMIASAINVAGTVTTALGNNIWTAMAGAVLFGATVVGIVSLVLTLAGRLYPTRPAKMMGKMTLSYGVAQMIAPAITGALAKAHGGYAIGLYLAAGAMLLGMVFLMFMRSAEFAEAPAALRREPVGESA